MNKKIKNTIVVATIILFIFGALAYLEYYASWSEEVSYDLQNIDDDGNYAIYYTVSSRSPGNNYEVVYVCFNNTMHTLKGNVSITYTDNNPYIDITRTHIVYGDDYHLYVPNGTVIYEGNVGTR